MGRNEADQPFLLGGDAAAFSITALFKSVNERAIFGRRCMVSTLLGTVPSGPRKN